MRRAPDAPTRSVITACPLDCPDACTLSVDVTNDAALGERITKIDAAPPEQSNPLTDGWICAKVRRSIGRVYSPERIHTPLARTGPKGSGEFEPITWDDALARTANAIRTSMDEHGPASVVPFLYNSSAASFSDRLSTRLFAELAATQVAHTICAATASIAWHATFPNMASADPLDVTHSDLVVVWGANPSASNTHMTPMLDAARQRGAAVVVIDPRRTPTAAKAQLHLSVRPGTDDALALSFTTRYAEDWRYCALWGKWLVWTGVRWNPDQVLYVSHLARGICRMASLKADSPRLTGKLASSATRAKSAKSSSVSAAVRVIVPSWHAPALQLPQRRCPRRAR